MNALDYILKANLYGLLFVGCYWLLLRRHTFFTLNRAYLLASVILSLILPLASLPEKTVEANWPVPVGVIALPVTVTATMPVETGPDWEQIALLVYGFIAFVLLLRLAIRVGRLFRFIQQSPRQICNDYILVEASASEASTPTFSFFRYLVLSPEDVQNELIIRHELVHIRQGHSVDVLTLALLRAVFWISPALWLIDRMLRQVHEFLADKQASQPTVYARFLVEYAFGAQTDTLTNGFFNPSLLKQRILMLHQKATNRWALGKYILVLPLAFGLLAMTTAREDIAAVVSQATEETITVSGRVTSVDGKALPGANVVIANTGKGTPTDQNGFYKLENVSVSATLAYSHIGYRTDILLLKALSHHAKKNQLTLSPKLTPNLQDELPPMGASAAYKAIKLNPAMPVRTPPTSETVDGKVLTAVEEPAIFPTGIIGLMQYVAQNLRYPTRAKATDIQGDVYVVFTILPTGTIGNVKVNKNIKPLGGGCEEEAIRVVSQMPKWIPATQNGKAVAIRYQIPIRFALEKKQEKRTGQIKVPSQADSDQKVGGVIIDNSKNAPYALYNDVKPKTLPLPDSEQKMKGIIDNSKNSNYSILGDLKGKPLLLLNGKTEISSLANIDPRDIKRTEFLMTSKAQVLYGPKAADGVVIIYLKGAWEQDPKVVRQTFLEIIESPAKETEYHIDRKQVTDKEVEKLRIENIRAIEWQKGLAPDRRFDIVNIYTR